jgi:hypothetical protein
MLLFILSDNIVNQVGQIAAIVVALYFFLFVVLFIVASLLFLYLNAWIRQQVRLVHQLRSIVESIDTTLHTPASETLPAALTPDNRLGQVTQAIHRAQAVQVVQIAKNTQMQVDSISKKVEPVADRIAGGVIEFRARTVMVQGMLKAFFLPGLVKPKPRSPLLLPPLLPTGVPTNAELPAGDSSVHSESSNVVVTQLNPARVGVQPASTGGPEPLENEGAKQSADAPGH